MGNVMGSLFSGFANAIWKLLSSPGDFLSGKSCSAVCRSWDLFCLVEHFCVADVLKFAIVFFLSYLVLLVLYSLYKIGFCRCIGHGVVRSLYTCVSCWFFFCELCFGLLCHKSGSRANHGRIYESSGSDDAISCKISASQSRRYRRGLMKGESLRPRRHHVRVLTRNLAYRTNVENPFQRIKVARTSKFSRKGSKLGLKHRKTRRRR